MSGLVRVTFDLEIREEEDVDWYALSRCIGNAMMRELNSSITTTNFSVRQIASLVYLRDDTPIIEHNIVKPGK